MICTITTVKLKPGTKAEFIQLFQREALEKTLNEQGCQEFSVYVDCPADGDYVESNRDDVITAVGKWDDLEAWIEHRDAEHIFMMLWDGLPMVESVTVRVLEPVR